MVYGQIFWRASASWMRDGCFTISRVGSEAWTVEKRYWEGVVDSNSGLCGNLLRNESSRRSIRTVAAEYTSLLLFDDVNTRASCLSIPCAVSTWWLTLPMDMRKESALVNMLRKNIPIPIYGNYVIAHFVDRSQTNKDYKRCKST